MAVDPAFAAELEAVAGEVSQPQPQAPSQGAGPLETLSNVNKAVGGGILKSIFETKDFVFGETPESEKSDIRRGVEQRSKELAQMSPINAVAGSIAQFATGMIGAGKITAPLKGIRAVANAGKAAKVAGEIGKAAAVGAVVFDPHEDRLSNLIQQFPPLANPVSEYLAAKPTDSAAEGRFKNALESIGMDVAMLGVFKATMAGYKYLKAGNTAKAEGSFAEAAKALEESRATELAQHGQAGATAAEQAVRDQPKTVGELFNEFRARKEPQAETPLQRAQRFQEEQPKGAADEVQAADRGVPPTDGPGTTSGGAAPAADAPRLAGSDTLSPVPAQAGLREGVTEAVPNLKAADATLPPGGPKPIPELPQETVPQLMAKVSGDVAALVRYGSREKAVSAGHSFGQGSSLPWQMWNTPEDVAAFAARIADEGAAELSKARGAMSDAALQRLVNQRVLLFNEKPDDIHGLLAQAGKNARTLAANMEASTAIGIKMTDEAMQVHAKIRAGNLSDFGGSYQAAMDEFGKRVGLSLEMLGEARSMLSGAGRALRRGRGDLERLSGSDLAKLEKLPVQALFHLFSEANGDLGMVARMLNKPTLLGKAVNLGNFLQVNNLLWGWKTHVINGVSNAWMLASRPAERLLGSAILQGVGKMDGAVASSMRAQAVREYRYTGALLWDGLFAAGRLYQSTDMFKAVGRAFKEGDSVINPHGVEYFRGMGAGGNTGQAFEWKPVANIGDVVNNALRALEVTIGLPTRTLGASDEMVKQITYRSVVMAEASMEADARGLSGAAARAHINAKLDDAFDANGAAVNEAALKEAQVRTFQQDLLPKTMGSTVQHIAANHPSLRMIQPFIKTPTNVLRYSIKLTPGLNGLQREYREMLSGAMGPEQQAHAVGQFAIGSLVLGAAASLVAAGVFTGSGPSKAEDKRNLLATGWQPNSFVKVNDDGTKTYTPINRFDPVAMPFGIMADIMDVIHTSDGEGSPLYEHAMDVAAGLGLSVINQLKDRSYLQGITQALQAFNDPEERGGKMLGRTAGSLVPFSSLTRMLTADPYVREVRGLTDGLMANTPGFSDKLEARRDVWGEKVLARPGFTSSTVDRIVDNEMVRMGLDAGQTFGPISPIAGDVDLREFTLEDGRNAYSVLQELSGRPKASMKSLKEQAAALFQSPAYQKAIDGDRGTKSTKQAMLSDLLGKYREPASQLLKAQSPKLREQMLEATLKAQAAFATGQKDAKAAGDMKGLQALGSAYGVDLGKMFPGLPQQ